MFSYGFLTIRNTPNCNNVVLSPGQTIEQSWIPHATLLGVDVEVVAKHYPTLLYETDSSSSWRKIYKYDANTETETARSACVTAAF